MKEPWKFMQNILPEWSRVIEGFATTLMITDVRPVLWMWQNMGSQGAGVIECLVTVLTLIRLLTCNKIYATEYYSGTPPYDHPVYKTTSLLRPYSFKPNVKTIESFYYFEDPVNATTSLLQPGFYGPTVVALTGSTVLSYL